MDIKNDKNVKSFNNISNAMLRFISKEGASQFPTVVLLANRMFLSDTNNIIKDKNIPFKIKLGCNFKWYSDLKYDEMRNNVRKCLIDIINDNLLCFKNYPDNPKNITNAFSMGNINYFITTDNKLQYGSLVSKHDIKFNIEINLSEVEYIYRFNPDLDIFITKHNLFFINVAKKTAKSIFSDPTREFKDYCICSNNKIVIATNKKGLVLIPDNSDSINYESTFTVQNEKLEYKEWQEEIPNPDYHPSETGEDDPTIPPTITVTKNNGLPKDNNLANCIATGNSVKIGVSFTSGTFDINNPNDKGYASSGISYHKYISEFESIRSGSGYKIGKYIYYTSYDPLGFTIDKDVVYIYNSTKIECYKYKSDNYDPEIPNWKDTRLIFTISKNNGIDSIKKFGCDGLKDLYCLTNNNEIYTSIKESDTDFPLMIMPIDYIFKRDQKEKNLKCQIKKCNIRTMIDIMVSDEKIDSLLTVFGKKALFLFMHYKDNFIYFGNDDRNKAAKEVKDIANAFDIG